MSLQQLLTSAPSTQWHNTLANLLTYAETPYYPKELEAFLRKIINFAGIAIIAYPGKMPPQLIHDSYTLEERFKKITTYLDGAYLFDPFFKAIKKGLPPGVYQLTEFKSQRFETSYYYQHYFASSGMDNELGIAIELEKGMVMFISLGLQRWHTITIADRQALTNILPILVLATQRFWQIYQTQYTPSDASLNTLEQAFHLFAKDLLTQREQEIVALILQGHSSKSAARALHISDSTIKVHRKNIYARLGISTQTQLFNLFLTHLLANRSSSG